MKGKKHGKGSIKFPKINLKGESYFVVIFGLWEDDYLGERFICRFTDGAEQLSSEEKLDAETLEKRVKQFEDGTIYEEKSTNGKKIEESVIVNQDDMSLELKAKNEEVGGVSLIKLTK